MSSKFWAELSSDYEKLFEEEIGYDVIIYAGEEQNVKEIHAHSNILSIRSQYFRAAFSNEWAEKKDGKFIFKKPNISPQLFNIILRFIYCGNIELKNLQGLDVLKLLIAVDELNIQPLISHIKGFLFNHKAKFLQQNPIGILETVYQYDIFMDLWNFCFETICDEPEILFNSDNFINLKAPLLELLLKRNAHDLEINEIEIWENLLKWCFSQQNMTNDPTRWNKEDITKVERELQKFIPLIRFYYIEPSDFFYKVYCYKDILPQDLIHDLLEFHDMVPNIAPSRKLGSTLIGSKHIPLFASWIDKKDSSYYDKKNIPYEFKLLYRSKRDGIDSGSFHENCDNKGATIWVAKVQGSAQLIGGYNPLDWDRSRKWKTTKNSFLFNFTNGKDIFTAKLGYVNDERHAVYCHFRFEPQMGDFNCFYPKGWTYNTNGTHYPNIGIPADFYVEDYEVFQVIKC